MKHVLAVTSFLLLAGCAATPAPIAQAAAAPAAKVVAGARWVEIAGKDVTLGGALFSPVAGKPVRGAIVMMHGCGGQWTRRGELTDSYRFWAEHFAARGYHALLLDSFGPRGEREICTQAVRKIRVDVERRQDAYAGIKYMAALPGVGERVYLVGWSNGATAVLNALRADGLAPPALKGAVALYPGCAVLAKQPYQPIAPLLIQSGAADDWTPAKHCETLVRDNPSARMEIDVYPDAHHSFDRINQPVRYRENVRNPNVPSGYGAHAGTNEAARTAAIARVTAFIESR